MTYLIAAAVLVGALCLVNLVLTLGVIRRLREHSALLSAGGAGAAGAAGGAANASGPRLMLEKGRSPAPAEASTRDGARLRTGDLAGSLVGFFSPTCQPCTEQAPRFVAHARRLPGRALAVVVGESAETGALVDLFAPVAKVVVEPYGGPLATAFEVTGFPAICLLDAAGAVVTATAVVDEIPVPASV